MKRKTDSRKKSMHDIDFVLGHPYLEEGLLDGYRKKVSETTRKFVAQI